MIWANSSGKLHSTHYTSVQPVPSDILVAVGDAEELHKNLLQAFGGDVVIIDIADE